MKMMLQMLNYSVNFIRSLMKTVLPRFSLLFLLTILFYLSSNSQCPQNIDFETGSFNNWTCYTGSVSAAGGVNTINLFQSPGPVPNQHTIYSRANPETDYFGGFPVNCPNGSGYSIKLGNNQGGGQAEGISYEFTIPPNRNTYSLIYHYAVVFQDPRHQSFQQPRLVIEVTNVSDNELIECSSFTFFPIGSSLPGFFVSPFQQDTTDVWCKDWSAVSINLNGKAGKTIRLFFKTADCTFTRHFGYAYIDVNTECSSEFVGATYCPGDAFVNVTAPYGYQNYTWYNNNFTQVIGNNQSINFTPPPPVGTTIAVQVVPYNGYGCLDTLYAQLVDTLTVHSNAGRDTFSCNQSPVQIGANPVPGYVYSWSPSTALSDPNIANPLAGPSITTSYILRTGSPGGGCFDLDTVVVEASLVDTSLRLIGKDAYCITSGDSSVLLVNNTQSIRWYRDNISIAEGTLARYKAMQSGVYFAELINNKGCVARTRNQTITIETPIPPVRYPDQFAVINYPQQLQARTIGVSAEWSPPTFLNLPTSFVPEFRGSTDKLYTIEIKTAGGCVTVDTLLVKVFKEVKFYVPSAFTPNKDGLNDFLKPLAVGIKEIKYFRVYNRWGQLVFDISNNAKGWDGNLKGKPQSSGTMVWMAEGIGIDNRVYKQKGTCVLIR